MNRIQFWILVAASSLVLIAGALQLAFSKQAQASQARIVAAQRTVEQGNVCATRLRQLATRIYQVSQQQHDQELTDLLARHDIHFTVTPSSSPSTTAPQTSTPAPSSTPPAP
jgi:hypothetical protein